MDTQTRFWRGFYDLTAPLYEATLELGARLGIGSEAKVRKKIIGNLDKGKGSLVLDLGCGSGNNRPALGGDLTYVGLDISRNMLNHAQTKFRRLGLVASWVQADAHALPIRNSSADVVIAMGVFQHLSKPAQALRGLVRASKSCADVLLIDERRSLRGLARRIIGKVGAKENEIIAAIQSCCQQEVNLQSEQIVFFEEYFILHMFKAAKGNSLTKL